MKNKIKSLKASANELADPVHQIGILERRSEDDAHILIPFQQKLESTGLYPLTPTEITTLQINVGKMCNQVCQHCHVDAGPDRKEIMTKATMLECLRVLRDHPSIQIVDLTGGAPEMNPDFRWFVEELKKLNRHLLVRCNLTIIRANSKYFDLPEFYKNHNIEIISSLPCYTKENTDKQRGDGVFEDSITALRMLNEVGYGVEGTGLILNLVYNPVGASLPPAQQGLELDYKLFLKRDFDIVFNQLYTITNLPVSRFLDYLLKSEKYIQYMDKLIQAYNPLAAAKVMCRSMLSVGWDGYLYDCDFNQMLEMQVNVAGRHIADFNLKALRSREILIGQHCYGCTAGAGSSCGGAVA